MWCVVSVHCIKQIARALSADSPPDFQARLSQNTSPSTLFVYLGELYLHRDSPEFRSSCLVSLGLVISVFLIHRWHTLQTNQEQAAKQREATHRKEKVPRKTTSHNSSSSSHRDSSAARGGARQRKAGNPATPQAKNSASKGSRSQTPQSAGKKTNNDSSSPVPPLLQSSQRQELLKAKLDSGSITQEEYVALTLKDIAGGKSDIDSGVSGDLRPSQRAPHLRSDQRRVLLQQKRDAGVITERSV